MNFFFYLGKYFKRTQNYQEDNLNMSSDFLQISADSISVDDLSIVSPYRSVTTQQELTCAYVADSNSPEIFIGTKYWLFIYYASQELNLRPKAFYSIGSQINGIDAYYTNNIIHVALATNDGFVHLLQISRKKEMKCHKHTKVSVFYEPSQKIILIGKNTIVSTNGGNKLAIVSDLDSSSKSWKSEIYEKNNIISSLKYHNNNLYLGYANGDIDILTSELETLTTIHLNDKILSIFPCSTNSNFLVVTEKSFIECSNENLSEFVNQIDFDEKISIAVPQSIQCEGGNCINRTFFQGANSKGFLFIINNNQKNKLENNHHENKRIVDIELDQPCTSATFIGDALIYLSGHEIYAIL
ncbi:hypothetical protein TRFO_03382 [Tritrichomonas foetus]|uniref:Uncharacterized protein n=1 Tax=Tritrichomonas foetus TaxID=1144522 RepID=A0A1J4KQQ0_9EUKA|nr:hypothetical protein TRFO_03382 [Tritrichomonas foetus]|eukprot:OHT13609.1 hypothetical protein TRFO_03382 [Tritrichomonas foetus]